MLRSLCHLPRRKTLPACSVALVEYLAAAVVDKDSEIIIAVLASSAEVDVGADGAPCLTTHRGFTTLRFLSHGERVKRLNCHAYSYLLSPTTSCLLSHPGR